MSSDATSPVKDSLKALLQKEGIERVAIVDDAFDSMAQRGLTPLEANDLWERLEFDDDFHAQLDQLGRNVETAEDLAGELIDELLKNQSRVPRFMDVWPKSIAGNRRAEAIEPVSGLRGQLEGVLDLDVRTFDSDTEPSTLVAYDPQLLFLAGISLVDKDGVDAGLAPLPSSGTGDAPFVEGASDVSHSVTSLGQVEDAPDDGSRVKWRASH